jgi:hypothetical protein
MDKDRLKKINEVQSKIDDINKILNVFKDREDEGIGVKTYLSWVHEFHTIAIKDDVLKKRFIELLKQRKEELEAEFKSL